MGAEARAVVVLADPKDSKFQLRLKRQLRSGGARLTGDVANAEVAVLIASPLAAANDALTRQVIRFVDRRTIDDLIIVLVRGSFALGRQTAAADAALSQQLTDALDFEPLWLDARTGSGADHTIERLVGTLCPQAHVPAPSPAGATSLGVPSAGPPPDDGTLHARRVQRRGVAIGPVGVASVVLAGMLAAGVFLIGRGDGGLGENASITTTATIAVPVTTTVPTATTTVPPATTAVPSPESTVPPATTTTPGPVLESQAPTRSAFLTITIALVGVAAGGLAAGWLVRRRRARSKPATPGPSVGGTSAGWPAPVAGAGETLTPMAFVSHDHEDRELVDALTSELRPDVDTWVSQSSLRPGDSWVFEISDALEGADAFIAVLTEKSLRSAWVRRELSAALLLHERSGSPRFLAFKAEPCRLPVLLETFQVIDAATSGFDMATRELKAAIVLGSS